MNNDELLAACEQTALRGGGPGGQHRQKNANGVQLRHRASGVVVQAEEERDRQANMRLALGRMRIQLALAGVMPLEDITDLIRQGRLHLTPHAKRWPAFVSHCCVQLHQHQHDLKSTATALELSTTQLVKAISGDKTLLTWVQDQRRAAGLHPLKPRS